MSLTEDDWLRQIAADPDDDAIRLIFADWLEEHGDVARAEFIRVQVRLAALPEKAPERTALTRRERELWIEHHDTWLAKVPKELRKKLTFWRGFAAHLKCTASQWLPSAERLQQACPLLTTLRLTNIGANQLESLAASPHLARLTMLDLAHKRIGDAGAAALAASPHLARLSGLHLVSNWIGDAGVTALAASSHLTRLTTLDLMNNMIGDPGVTALAASPYLARLISLIVAWNYIGTTGAKALAASPHLARLTSLHLECNHIGTTGKKALQKRFGDGVRF